MKRRLFKLVLFLLLGAVVNVAVAWGCALVVDLGSRRPEGAGLTVDPAHGSRSFLIWRGVGAFRIINDETDWAEDRRGGRSWVETSSLPHWTALRAIPPLQDGVLWDDARGWPFLALRCRFGPSDDIRNPYTVLGGLFVRDHPMTGRVIGLPTPPFVLPYQPIWTGFAINTVFYAAILWLLTLGPFTARRMIRRKRGRCIKCGYDLRGAEHEACPECGARCDGV